MQTALNLEFLIPVLIGIGCLVFSMRTLFRNESKSKAKEGTSDDEALYAPLHISDKNLEPGRKAFYVILFAGLGAASIVFGWAALYPALGYLAKGIIILTIITSMIVNAQIDKKLKVEQLAETEQEQEQEQETKTDV